MNIDIITRLSGRPPVAALRGGGLGHRDEVVVGEEGRRFVRAEDPGLLAVDGVSSEALVSCVAGQPVFAGGTLLTGVELPLIGVLARMEQVGIAVDHDLLTISLQLLTQMVLTFDSENISTRCWPLNISTQVGQYDCKNIWWSTCHP